MKNILLQHWSGDMNELGERSSENMAKYAKYVNADYQLLRGDLFHPALTPPCQKLHMLNKVFDEYDMIVMVDADMFTRKGLTENVFTDAIGIGRHTTIQDQLIQRLCRQFPKLGNMKYPYWGGSIYRLNKDLRQKLRQHIHDEEIRQFNHHFFDEGIMHRLAVLAQIEIDDTTFLPGNHWNCGSFEPELLTSAFIHIRTKIAPQGPKRPKLVNYKGLVEQGIIEE